jgi:porphobilinogen synthase
MNNRFRRLRKSAAIRDLVRETILTRDDLILPLFVIDGKKKRQNIPSMPDVARLSIDNLLKEIEVYLNKGGKAGLLFGIPHKKDQEATTAFASSGVVQKAIRAIKKEFPEFLIFTDVCLCSYTSHGHCGVLENGQVHNDKTLPLLAKIAVSHAQAGADFVAPSDMMDFRVKGIRDALDKEGLIDAGILSYAVKYASAFYGPFRDAANSAPQKGDRKSYQMDPANIREAIKEAKQDVVEGADMVMVKPALAYLDVISYLKCQVNVPVVAYNVSGEYSMVKAAAQKKWINEKSVVLESLTSMKRAGADIIITYHAKDVLTWL